MITGVVLARNEEANIVACLKALRPHAAEIILIDMESTDRTVDLARPFVSKVLRHPWMTDFDSARNTAIDEASHDWLRFVDADDSMQDGLACLRATKPEPPFGVVWRADVENESGYAEEARSMIKALARRQRPLVLDDLSPRHRPGPCALPTDRALFQALRNGRWPRQALAVTHAPAGGAVPDDRAAVNVLRTMIETDRVPVEWLAQIARFDEIWVPSRHVADAFRRSWVAPEKIRIVPGCLDANVFSTDGDRLPLPPSLEGRLVFLSIFDWVPRKGSDLLVTSYCREFAPDEPVGLLLKVTRVHGQSSDEIRRRVDDLLGRCGQTLAGRPDVVLWDELLTDHQMAAMYRAADAFVLPSRGEGWGRPYMEAMACGLPTLGTAASGNLDFMNDENSLLIPAVPVDVPDEAAAEFPLFRGHRWFEPDAAELRRLIRQVYTDGPLRKRLGRQASGDVRQRFSLTAGGRAIEAAVQAVEERHALHTAPGVGPGRVRVVLEGELYAAHSFSNINERLCVELGDNPALALSLRRVRHAPEQPRPHDAHRIEPYVDRDLGGPLHVTIRHAYPPNWTPPERGRWIHIQPWEYGHLPIAWLPALRDRVDEIWAPSQYVKRVYERSGIRGEKIQVIPWGVDAAVFAPDATPLLLPTAKTFRFLYVGGTIARKGFDRLLAAYLAEFQPGEDVCLVVKDNGADTVYRHSNHRRQAIDAQGDSSAPALLYLDRPMTPGQLAGLYTACDCFVAPYRGEGFGLPILEAMACGLPPIVPRGGASDDFVRDQTAWILDSEETECEFHEPLCGPALELSIGHEDLRRKMREAYRAREETHARGLAASADVRSHFTWKETARRMAERIQAVTEGDRASSEPSSTDASPQRLPTKPPFWIVIDVGADTGPAALADTLARVRPFADRVICAGEHLPQIVCRITNEYASESMAHPALEEQIRRAAEFAPRPWLLNLRAGEKPDEEDLARLYVRPPLATDDAESRRVRLVFRDEKHCLVTRRAALHEVAKSSDCSVESSG